MQQASYKSILIPICAALALASIANAEIDYQERPGDVTRVRIVEDTWRPDGFEEGLAIPALFAGDEPVTLDGLETESIWAAARDVEVQLSYGKVDRLWIKALYTDDDVIFRVRWADATENRQHHPWVWDEAMGNYTVGPQVEDSLMFSFESGCEWFPSFLSGYAFDFDAWHWMAGRTDPYGQALDLSGSMKDSQLSMNMRYSPRNTENEWNLRFTDLHDGILYKQWEDLDRQFMIWPVLDTVYFHANFDGSRGRDFELAEQPASSLPSSPALVPRYAPLELEGNAAEVEAKGQWSDGHWTVELRRQRVTPGGIGYDTQFTRLTQFSLHVFDAVERLDQSSESGRLWLTFIEKEPSQTDLMADAEADNIH